MQRHLAPHTCPHTWSCPEAARLLLQPRRMRGLLLGRGWPGHDARLQEGQERIPQVTHLHLASSGLAHVRDALQLRMGATHKCGARHTSKGCITQRTQVWGVSVT